MTLICGYVRQHNCAEKTNSRRCVMNIKPVSLFRCCVVQFLSRFVGCRLSFCWSACALHSLSTSLALSSPLFLPLSPFIFPSSSPSLPPNSLTLSLYHAQTQAHPPTLSHLCTRLLSLPSSLPPSSSFIFFIFLLLSFYSTLPL